jgi:hypothetical protein
MSNGSPMEHISTWMLTLTSKMSDLGVRKSCGHTAVSPLHPEGFTTWCALSSVEIFWFMFTDGIIASGVYLRLLSDNLTFPVKIEHSKELNMVSARWCWTSHRQCHTSLSL